MKRHEITLEITTRCNLSCAMCPHGLPEGIPNKRDADDRVIDAVIAQAGNYKHVRPTGVGEPLMAPGFWRIVDLLARTRISQLAFVTNGSLLTQQNVDRLTKARLSSVNISVDAADPATYLRIRGQEMRRTITGIERFVAAAARMPEEDRPTISLSMVLMKENIEEADDFVRLAHSLGITTVYFEHLITPYIDAKQWNVVRGNWRFNYAEQRLSATPAYSDEQILKAMDTADLLEMQIAGPSQLLLPENQHLNFSRPCRYFSTVQHRDQDLYV